MIFLNILDLTWYLDLGNTYNLSFLELIIFFFLSILSSIILHKFFNKTEFKTSNNNKVETLEVKKYSFVTKTIVVFFILILVSMPIFKLLNTGYFL